MMKLRPNNEKGAVSLFVVIFAALLIITIATAFIRIMLQDQMQATANDLSKSALDSANAGVEDAKRALVEYYRLEPAAPDPLAGSIKPDCSTDAGNANTRCLTLRRSLSQGTITPENDGWTDGCQATIIDGIASLSGGTDPNKGEVTVKTNGEDSNLNQAYTCVKVQMNPQDYIGALTPNTSRLLQLKSLNNDPFSKIKIQWYTKQIGQADLGLDSEFPYKLTDAWPTNRPAVIRAQLLQYNAESGFKLSDFDSDNKFNSTLFLLPSGAGSNVMNFADDIRQQNTSDAAKNVFCKLENPRYACEATITLPDVGSPKRAAYLKLSQFYGSVSTDFRITMYNDADKPVRFSDVQPAVDSTGRANDLFRRVRSRIELGASSIPNAEAAVDITKSLCKDFAVTNDTALKTNDACPALPQ
ncbi:MAG: hypothetical protein JWN75_1006 [Candidatus Saccharibacteria bacterium]|nr:hypothetical protein [Candidatus Saccharibacteria bacterium]